MTTAAELRALVLTMDPWLAVTFTDLARELGIHSQTPENLEGIPTEVRSTKYEGVLVDFDTVAETHAILGYLKTNPSNKSAVIFAVATGAAQKKEVLEAGIKFVLERPFAAGDLRRALYSAYDAMAQERRRYFRCAVELPVQLRRNEGEANLTCKTINVSSHGMAVSSSTSFPLAERLEIALMLQEVAVTIIARGTVVWDDKHGKTGISFDCANPEIQCELDKWLDSQFLRGLLASRTKAGIASLPL